MKTAPLIGISRHRLTTDGEGVTTLVAFHGCPLRCKYCLNPQSLHSEGIWKHYDCMQLYEEVRLDELYFLATHGGITFGGGEPCLQSDFIYEFRQLCGQEWQLSVESSLNVPQENIEKLLPVIDYYIIDIKDINNDIYQHYSCKENEKVLNYLHYLIEHGKYEQIIVRTPIIPVYNSESDVDNSIRLIKEMGFTQFDRFTFKTLNTYQP